MNSDKPMTDPEAVAYLETLDHLYGRLRPIESRAETVLEVARSAGDEQAVARVEAILTRLGEGLPPTRHNRAAARWQPSEVTPLADRSYGIRPMRRPPGPQRFRP